MPHTFPGNSYDLKRYSSCCAEGARIDLRRLLLNNNSDLNCITFIPAVKKNYPPVVFFAGFASVIENFKELLIALTENFTVHYVETRDKESSILPKEAGFTVYDVASDIFSAIDTLGMPEGKYIILAFSLGSTATAEAFRSFPVIRPQLLILAAPNGRFRIPPIGIFIARYLSWSYYLIRPFLKWYIKTFHVNTKEDYEMYNISVRALDMSDPRKMAPTLLEMVKYEIWDALDKIDIPVIVIGASKDIFHTHDDALEISSAIVNSKYYDLETNKRTHSREVSDLLLSHLKEMDN
jgi:pimeloyl-ACP methyl ester carboxylesterase